MTVWQVRLTSFASRFGGTCTGLDIRESKVCLVEIVHVKEYQIPIGKGVKLHCRTVSAEWLYVARANFRI